MTRRLSRAEEARAAREAFALAMQLGCTPKEAECEQRRRRSAARRACGRLIAAEPCPAFDETLFPAPIPSQFRDWNAPWMMRD